MTALCIVLGLVVLALAAEVVLELEARATRKDDDL